jgi:hypothetical protein
LSSDTPSLPLYDSTSTRVKKYVRKMCLFLVVKASWVIYTSTRKSTIRAYPSLLSRERERNQI